MAKGKKKMVLVVKDGVAYVQDGENLKLPSFKLSKDKDAPVTEVTTNGLPNTPAEMLASMSKDEKVSKMFWNLVVRGVVQANISRVKKSNDTMYPFGGKRINLIALPAASFTAALAGELGRVNMFNALAKKDEDREDLHLSWINAARLRGAGSITENEGQYTFTPASA